MNKTVKNTIIGLVIAAVGVGFFFIYSNFGGSDSKTVPTGEKKTEANGTAADFKVYDQQGNKVSLSDFKGKPVVLNFAASWCHFCVEEMPEFQKAYDKYKDQVSFLIVDAIGTRGETPEDFDKMVKEGGYTFTYYYDKDQSALEAYGVTSFPQTYYINREGKVANRNYGAIDYNTLEKQINSIL